MVSEEKKYQLDMIKEYWLDLFKSDQIQQEDERLDIVIKKENRNHILIEFKHLILNEKQRQIALAQIVLTSKKHNKYGGYYGIFYKDSLGNDVFEYFEHNDYIFNNNAVYWENNKQPPSNPIEDNIKAIVNSLNGKLFKTENKKIKEITKELLNNDTQFTITENNCISIFNEWLENIKFKYIVFKPNDDMVAINLFLTDLLNSDKSYKNKELLNTHYRIFRDGDERIIFADVLESLTYFEIEDFNKYNEFWKIYKRPPSEEEFVKIIEKRNEFFNKAYRSSIGGEYTPQILVDLQNEILKEYLGKDWQNEYIVFDPCAGVGNLEDDFANEYKDNCYLSTLEQGDAFVSKTKYFTNSVVFDFLENDNLPLFNYKSKNCDINEIAKILNKKVLVLMNPPYVNLGKTDTYIEFIKKSVAKIPNCTMFIYCKANIYHNATYFNELKKLQPQILYKNIISAKIFGLSDWGITMSLWDFSKKEKLKNRIELLRYEIKNNKIEKQKEKVIYDDNKKLFFDWLGDMMEKDNQKENEIILGHYTKLGTSIVLYSDTTNKNNITNNNLETILFASGITYHTHLKYYELENIFYKMPKKIIDELKNNAIINSLFYILNRTTNKNGEKNYFTPFTEKELGLHSNLLNAKFVEQKSDIADKEQKSLEFDFRIWLEPYKMTMTSQGKDLYNATLKIYKFYLEYFGKNADVNAGWSDIKDALSQQKLDTKISFDGQKNNKLVGYKTRTGENSAWRPSKLDRIYKTTIFSDYEEALKNLLTKIQEQMLECEIVLQKPSSLR